MYQCTIIVLGEKEIYNFEYPLTISLVSFIDEIDEEVGKKYKQEIIKRVDGT